MEVHEILIEANRAVELAKLPSELKPTAFGKAVELIVGGGTSQVPRRKGAVEKVDEGASGHALAQIAKAVAIPPSIIEEVYYEEGGELSVVVGPGKLEKTASGATRQLALLVAGGRQLAGFEDWTGVNRIRDACVDFGKYDSANFSASIKNMESSFSVRGKGMRRELKINRPGREQLTQLLKKLTGEEA